MRSAECVIAAVLATIVIESTAQPGVVPGGKPQATGIRPDVMAPRLDPRGQSWTRSAWRESEKSFYADLLAKGRFDILVVPFQVQEYALDRATRSLMTALLASALAEATKASIPDPYLVARALGDGERRLQVQEAYRLAARLGVKKVIWGYVGHDESRRMRLSFQQWDRQGQEAPTVEKPVALHELPIIEFNDEYPPVAIFEGLLARVLRELGFPPLPTHNVPRAQKVSLALPDSPNGLAVNKSNAVRDAYGLQLLASLTPWHADRARERFVEKSFLATGQIRRDTPEYRVLRARAYMHLGLRPAALTTLDKANGVEERFLREVLNGNLPEALSLASRIPAGIPRVLAELEINAIATEYEVRTQRQSVEAVATLALPGRVWPMLVTRAATDQDIWAQFDNISFKGLLDAELPVAGFTAEDLIRGAAALGDPAQIESQMHLSVLEHHRRLLDAQDTEWCCRPLRPAPTKLDYLDLVEAIGTDNLMRQARFLVRTQANARGALRFLAQIERSYKDHPQYSLARGQAEAEVAESAQGTAKRGLIQSAATNGFNALYWEQCQTPTSAAAFYFVSRLAGAEHFQTGNPYAGDLPYRAFYPNWAAGGNKGIVGNNSHAKLKSATLEFEPVTELAWLYGRLPEDEALLSDVFKAMEGRFNGHPRRTQLLAKHRLDKGDLAGAEQYYREGIKAHPAEWQARFELGRLLFEQGRTADAASVFKDFPGFTAGSGVHAVTLANHAYDAANLFYWTGYFEHAIPLFQIAANLETGSDSSLASRIRLDLIEGRLHEALAETLNRAQRYNSSFAYRDYFGLLHALGKSEEAWSGFNLLQTQHPAPHIWETVTVGQRIAALTESDVFAWVNRDPIRRAGADQSYAAVHLLRSGTMDRLPSETLAARIREMERPVWLLTSYQGKTARPSLDGSRETVLGPSTPDGAVLPIGVFKQSQKSRVQSELASFAEAVRAIHAADYSKAHEVMREAAQRYDMTTENLGFLLPYYAYAAARHGQTADILAYLDKVPRRRQRFDYYLARAMMAGIAGKHAEAERMLRTSLHRRLYTQHRAIIVEYQFGELVDWLHDATGDPRYRAIALDWARKTQQMQPWFAWSYALEAKHASSATDRRIAIAKAHYLDSNSQRLAKLPAAEVSAAVKEQAGRNPFLSRDPREKDKST